MAGNYIGQGKVIQWTNAGTAKVAGAVVAIGNKLGVCLVDIANGATGSVAMDGIFTVPKVSGAVIAQGETLTWDASAAAFDDNAATPASGDITGAACYAWEAAGNGVTELEVMFCNAPGTKTA
jgi:predicted RecA/RadA family phage recombinase